MHCCVPFCENTSDNVSTSYGEGKAISFHGFPSEVQLRAAWLRALGKQDNLPDSAVVCSQHFLNNDIYETESGLRKIHMGAIPSTVQVCMICLDTDSKLLLMSYELEEAYEKLIGQPLCDQGNLKHTICVQCTQRLINFSRFRDESLRARALMMDLVQKHEFITRQHMKLINSIKHRLNSNMTKLDPDHCDLHILEHPSEDHQKELEETRLESIMKIEGNDESMMADEDLKMENEDDNNVSDFILDPLKYESSPYQCTLCWEEFVHEHAYMQHLSMHVQQGDGDGEWKTSQVCKPHTAVSCSSAYSSLITENKQADPNTSAHSVQILVAPLSARLATVNEDKESANEATDAVRESNPVFEINTDAFDSQTPDISCKRNINISELTNCVVKLNDVFKDPKKFVNQNILSKDISYHATSQHQIPTTVDVGPVINTVKALQSETDCLKNVNNTQCNNSLENSSNVKERGFICNICEYKCKYQSYLKKHMRTHTGLQPFLCKLCNYRSTRKGNLLTHMRTHTGEKPFLCELCDFKCTTNSRLMSHTRTHTGVKPYSCELCDYRCTDSNSLVRHMRTHTGIKPFLCNLCNYKFTDKSTLVKHMTTHTGEKPFSCNLCDYKCPRNSYLVRHMSTHTGIKPFLCNLCNYKFTDKSTLVKHMTTRTGEKPFSCNLCDYKCARNSYLVRHMRTHTGIKPFLCNLCNYKCTEKSTLVKHMTTHTGEKPFSCKLCDYKCARNCYLVKHTRTHTGIKPYSCELCNYRFTVRSHLVRHMRTHTGIKPFLCNLCNYKSTDKNALVRHMRIHMGEKPYSCKICEYKCAHRTSLLNHNRRTHTATGVKPSSSS
ncbi:zinc finger protein 432-like isoform X3 [Maniola jurtina]|uniref:zinc finger protein 432-like isoform X3 n=1 Tax=Maniola jurtina TaxID=191418 RepID=UPI001E68DF2C|nr:zinc finger protein 432-like isoform X3 [Maniola jurtina]